MTHYANALTRIFNALEFDNVGNLGELRRKLREAEIPLLPQPKQVAARPARHLSLAPRHVLAK